MNPSRRRSGLGKGKECRPSRQRSAWGFHALAWGLSVAFLATSASAWSEDSIRIEEGLAAGPYYVGQEIKFTLRVAAAGERPSVAPFRVAGADVAAIGAGPTASGPVENGAGDRKRDVHRFEFRIVPKRTGTLTIPRVGVRQGPRSISSRPVRFPVRPLPSGGRPRGFLGGVGAFRVEADASPRLVRLGGEIEYRLRIVGPASRSSRDAPDLTPFDRVPLGLRISRLPDEEVTDPPSRVYRYRVRPTRPGSAVLPPLTVASFDPKSAQYLTKASPGVPVRVADPPSLDPATLTEAPHLDASTLRGRPTLRRVAGWMFGLAAALAALAGLGLFARRRRTRGRGARFAARMARRLDADGGAAETARRVADGLAAYLNLTAGRTPGVLTPAEAAEAIEVLTQRPALAEDARRLVADCDRARYSGDGTAAEGLVAGAKRLFLGLQVEGRRNGGARQSGGGGEVEGPKRGSRDRE